jgi:hypothetical protein
MHLAVQIRRLIVATSACAAVVFGATFLVGSGRAQAGRQDVTHTCSAADKQFIDTVRSNMTQLAYWSDSLLHEDVAPAAAKTHGGNAGNLMHSAYTLANAAHDLLAAAQPELAARGCDPALLLQ